MNVKLAQIVNIFLIFILLASILAVGFLIRTGHLDTSLTNNIVDYYFDRANRLIHDGSLPAFDRWGFAPALAEENTPPFLPYMTAGAFQAANYILGGGLNAKGFILFFPVLLFLIWAGAAFLILKSFSRRIWSAILGVLIIVFSPLSIAGTFFGRYAEETLGAFLFFLCFWFFLKRRENIFFYFGLIVLLTALALTWQQFHIFFIAMALVLIVDLFLDRQEFSWRNLFYDLASLVAPFIIGHVISLAVGTGYSPIKMLWEFWLGFRDFNADYILSAMRRNDWAALSLKGALAKTGLFFGLLAVVGLMRSFLEWRHKKYRTVLIFNLLAMVLAFKFSKNSIMLLPFGLYAAVIGWESLFDNWQIRLIRRDQFRAAANLIKKSWQRLVDKLKFNKKISAIICAGIVVIGGFFWGLSLNKHQAPPDLNFFWLQKPDSFNNNGLAGAKLLIKNIGGDSLATKGATAGIHLELKNAEALKIVGWQGGEKISPVLKADYRRGNIFWFEIVFKPLKADEEVLVNFSVRRINTEEMEIFYRGWLPNFCPLIWQREAARELVGQYSDLSYGGWRSENCIVREPANTAKEKTDCQVEVFAAHKESRFYQCERLGF